MKDQSRRQASTLDLSNFALPKKHGWKKKLGWKKNWAGKKLVWKKNMAEKGEVVGANKSRLSAVFNGVQACKKKLTIL